MFSLHHGILLSFCGCFHCWLHLFISPTLGFSSLFLVLFGRFCFTIRYFFFVLLYRECYGFERAFFNSQVFFTFPTFGTTCFYQGFPGSRQFFLKCCKASHWGSKHRPSHLLVWITQYLFVQHKVLVGKCYLCTKVRRNTILTSSRFWTHYLIAIYMS